MSAPEVTVIDYGVGNLLSVQRGLEHCGAKVTLTADPERILSAKRVVLPGVGAFENAMMALGALDLVGVIKEVGRRETPVLGICLGMQCAVIEFARNVIGLKDAHSTEMNPSTSSPVIDLLEDQKNISHMGGTMRLGSFPCKIKEGTLANKDLEDEMKTLKSFGNFK
jgi:CTP synthase (UTP-ammonia lyase)